MKNPTANITLASLEDKGLTMKLKDSNGKSWVLWKNDYQTKQPSEAYGALMNHKIGDTFGVEFGEKQEEYQGKEYTKRTIYNILPPVTNPTQSPLSEAPVTSGEKDDAFWEKQAYEKCCSLWAASVLGTNKDSTIAVSFIRANLIENGRFWELFQAIKADGNKRFATGWSKAEAIFKEPELPVIQQTECEICGIQGVQANDGHDCIPF